MLLPDVTTLVVVGPMAVGLTQLIKDFGVQGEWLKLVNVLVAIVLGYLMLNQPALWSTLILPLVGATGTGGVSFVHDLLQKMKEPSQG